MKKKGFWSWLPASKKDLAKTYAELADQIGNLDTRTKAIGLGLGLTSLVVLGQIARGVVARRQCDDGFYEEDEEFEEDGNFLEFDDEPSEESNSEEGGEN